jgi:hypothetical protein
MVFPQHVVIRARCEKRWRGANFDAAVTEAAVGASVANALHARVKTTPELEAFMRRVFVRGYQIATDESGEDHEFHVGMRERVDDATFAAVEEGARAAVAAGRHFRLRDG